MSGAVLAEAQVSGKPNASPVAELLCVKVSVQGMPTILRPQSGGASLEDYVSIVTRGEGLSTQKLCVGRSRRAYSSFGIAADRRHTLKWLFHQEKATFLCTQEVYTNSENALKCAGPDGLPHRIVAATGSVLTPPSQVGSLHKGAYGRFKPLSALQQRPRRLARPRTPPFHGDNTGSNPVGDATKINSLDHKQQAKVNLK